MNLSKSRYTKGVQCPKMLWMDAHMPEQFDESVMNQAILETGNVVGDLAMGYFGDFVEVPFSRDFAAMERETWRLLDEGCPIICEATFSHQGDLCMVDILLVESDGVRIVEVKSSTHVKDINYHDMAFQVWVLTQCDLNVKSVGLMHLNNQYVRQGELNLQELFVIEDCTDDVFAMLPDVEARIPQLKRIASATDEPALPIGPHCKNPYECGYRGWCWKHLPKPSVFDLNRIRITKAMNYMDEGILTLQDAFAAGIPLNPRQLVQVMAETTGPETIVNVDEVRSFLEELTFPLYFLDFETFQPAIPPFDGVRPYQQIPTQYSLHIVHEPGGLPEHREFLAEAGTDPRRAIAQSLVENIPADVCVLAYSMGFEKGRIAELADACSDLGEHLLSINWNMRDLIVPFQSGSYYDRAMGGSNSIKAVLPALFPNDPDLDYHALEGVHNGSEAMDAFGKMADMSPEEIERTREQLLRYCELDTLAMVKIWEKLCEATA